ncbi:DUF4124 domain-containing protein [Lysobacter terrae]
MPFEIPGRRPLTRIAAAAALLFAIAMPSAHAQGVVIYRCTDANGALTIQNGTPCPKGNKQERRVIESAPPSSAPPFVAPPAPHKPAVAPPPPRAPTPIATRPLPPPEPAVESEPAIADADRLPPPWLYECHTYDNDKYLSEDGDPKQRCVTLTTTGLGGLVENNNNTAACEVKIDQCQRVPDGALCDGWRRRLRDAQSALRFGVVDDRAKAEAEVRRITRVVRESTCARQ